MTRAMILLSGGIDSMVCLALAHEAGSDCTALSFDYKQRHRIELQSAAAIAAHYRIPHQIIPLDPALFGKSALVSATAVPKDRAPSAIANGGIPDTYVPARNTLFLTYAMALAEIHDCDEIYYGPSALDLNAYPDCTPRFVSAFQGLLNVATKQAIEGKPPTLLAPTIQWDKQRTIEEALRLKAPLHLTSSCYDPPGPPQLHCGRCDACLLRKAGFAAACQPDPTRYSPIAGHVGAVVGLV